MNQIKKWLSPTVFCAFLLVFFVLLIISPDTEYSEKEKRYLETSPEISLSSILDGSYQKKLEDWIADQFPGRDLWVGLHAYSQLLLGKNAHQSIYMADNGYLINAPATQDLTDFEKTLQRFDKFAGSTNLPATLLMVPSTGYLHEAALPMGHDLYPDDDMYALASSLAQNLSVIDVRDALVNANSYKPVAYRTDHHLTSYGNHVLYSALREFEGKSSFSPEHYQIEIVPGFRGTTWSGSGYWLTPADDLEIWDSGIEPTVTITDGGQPDVTSDTMYFRTHLEELDKYPVFLDGNHALTTITNPNAEEGTLLIVKDSYAHGFAPFLAEHYQTVYLLDLRYYRGKVSDFTADHNVDELLFLYGTSTLLTDTNSAWLF
jgi:hypothetical protein